MRVSAIEIGTNSTKFIIAELTEKGSIEVIRRTSIVNRLSNGMYQQNSLKPVAVEKEIEIIGDLIHLSKMHGAELISIFSTSVLRDAFNKDILIDRVKVRYGIDINVISGDQEAYLAYMACKEIVENKAQKFAVIDIGGGSTEIIVGKDESIDQKVSLDVGTVRLTEMFTSHDPILDSEFERMSNYIQSQIDEKELVNLSGLQLVGTGGTIKSLGTILFIEEHTNECAVNGRVAKRQEIEMLFEELKLLNIEEKKKFAGLNPKRADVITTGVYILLSIMNKFSLEEIKISTQGVLEGFIAEYFQTIQKEV